MFSAQPPQSATICFIQRVDKGFFGALAYWRHGSRRYPYLPITGVHADDYKHNDDHCGTYHDDYCGTYHHDHCGTYHNDYRGTYHHNYGGTYHDDHGTHYDVSVVLCAGVRGVSF